MELITEETIESLLATNADVCVSIYMPAHRTGREIQQDPVRLKNLLRESEESLLKNGVRSTDVSELLDPAKRLLNDSNFWRHQSDGLALLISVEGLRYYRLPVFFDELAVVGKHFHLKPLLPFITSDGHFYVLALSQKEVRLFEGTRQTIDEVGTEGFPASLAESLKYDDFEKQLQSHTRTQSEGGARSAVFHGHDPADESKERIFRWLQQVDSGLRSILMGQQSPLVLAGVEYLLPIYHEANSYPQLMDDGILGNPEELSPEDLQARAIPIVMPCFTKAQEQAQSRYQQLSETELTATDVEEIVVAAHDGRVDALLVASDAHVWGDFDPATRQVQIHSEAMPGDEDLLDEAAMRTYLKGGEVYVLEPHQMAGDAPLAAVLRY